MRVLVFVVGMLLVAPAATAAQGEAKGNVTSASIVPTPSGEIYEILLTDGTRAFGRVERVDAQLVTFRTTSGATLEVARGGVLAVRPVQGQIKDGEFWPADPNQTRLFFAPTGRALKRGEGYFGVYEILLPFVQVGITDRISVGAGTPLIFGAGSAHPFWVTPKVQVLTARKVDASVGVMHFLNVGEGSVGIGYAVATFGSTDSAFTGGVGYAYERGEVDGGSTVAMIGGEHRVKRGAKLITENYIWSGGGLSMFGVRWLGERLSADLGLLVPLGEESTFAFPMVNFVWKFSRD